MSEAPFTTQHLSDLDPVLRIPPYNPGPDETRIDVLSANVVRSPAVGEVGGTSREVNSPAGAPGLENAPGHYKTANGLQSFDVIDAYELDFYLGNAWKYLTRWDKKGNGATDLEKAVHYLQEALARTPADRSNYGAIQPALTPGFVLNSFGFTPDTPLYEAVNDLLLSRSASHPRTYLRSALGLVRDFLAEL